MIAALGHQYRRRGDARGRTGRASLLLEELKRVLAVLHGDAEGSRGEEGDGLRYAVLLDELTDACGVVCLFLSDSGECQPGLGQLIGEFALRFFARPDRGGEDVARPRGLGGALVSGLRLLDRLFHPRHDLRGFFEQCGDPLSFPRGLRSGLRLPLEFGLQNHHRVAGGVECLLDDGEILLGEHAAPLCIIAGAAFDGQRRFDRQVMVPRPDIDGREQILKVHMKKVPLAPDVDNRVIARGTPGFSGADLANLVNEAALLAAPQSGSLFAIRIPGVRGLPETTFAG